MELYQVSADSLDTWIALQLQPTEEFLQQVREAVRRVCDFLKEKCSLDAKVVKTVKAGSAVKGTALEDNSDADVVLFLSCFSSFQDQKLLRESMIESIKMNLNKHWQSLAYNINILPPKRNNGPPRALTLTIQSKQKYMSIEVDILPAYDALGQVTADTRPPPEVYVGLIRAKGEAGEFATCFTELQRNFVKRCPTKLKNLLRLVKHWYKEVKEKLRKHDSATSLPPKYALELLTIYAWESGTQEADKFSTAAGFCTVMRLLIQYQELCIYWTKYYDLEHPEIGAYVKQQLKGQRPVILDPADPTGNLGKQAGWDLMAKEAATCQKQQCCKNGSFPVHPWKIQPVTAVQVTVKQLAGFSLSLKLSPYVTFWQVKEEIDRAWTVSPYEQRLALKEPGMQNTALQDDQKLADHGVFYDVTILQLKNEPQEMEIFVKDNNSRTPIYQVHPRETVLDLKAKISGRTGISVDQQRLTYSSKELENRHELAHYRIHSRVTIYLLLRLRGG
uniref:2'-5' oligoadenylate synthase n=1 Tax=Sphenodon punctatus TaxID=8508 RepID=A0A8D0L1L9_SPHPU